MENTVGLNENQGKRTIELKAMIYPVNENITNNYTISEKLFEKNEFCTYFMFGDLSIEQPKYICGRCDIYGLDPMCQSCYQNCHRECWSIESRKQTTSKLLSLKNTITNTESNLPNSSSETNSPIPIVRGNKRKDTKKSLIELKNSALKGTGFFACVCGKEHKHCKIKAKPDRDDEKNVKKCNLLTEIPHSLFPSQQKFHCKDCDVLICILCAGGCHMLHNVSPSVNFNFDTSIVMNCNCYNSNHSLNEFLLNIYFIESSYGIRFRALLNSQIKILNMMYLTKDLFGNMSKFMKKILMKISLSSCKMIIAKKNQDDNLQNPQNILTTLNNINEEGNNGGTPDAIGYDENRRKFFDLSAIFFKILYDKNDKCYFYNEELRSIFDYQKIFVSVLELSVSESQSKEFHQTLNLVGIVFYLHLKSDFQKVKNFSISDFLGSSIATRLRYRKKFLESKELNKNQTGDEVNDDNKNSENLNHISYLIKKYFDNDYSLTAISINLSKILTICLPMQNILEYPHIYEVCLRFINFGLKKMYFSKKELKILIENLSEFFMNFFVPLKDPKVRDQLVMNLEKTRYVFYYMSKICYMIAINYNDMITEELIEEFKKINNLIVDQKRNFFIHSNREYGDKLLKMSLKTITLLSQSYTNDAVIDRKIINICNESLKLFSVTDNFYLKQIESLNEIEINENILNTDEEIFKETLTISNNLSQKIKEIFIRDHSEILSGEIKIYLGIDQILKNLFNLGKNSPDKQQEGFDKTLFLKNKDDKISSYRFKLIKLFTKIHGDITSDKFLDTYDSILNLKIFMNHLISGNFDEIISKYFSLFKLKYLDDRDINGAMGIYLLFCLDIRGIKHLCLGKNLSIITQIFSHPKNINELLYDEIKIEFLYLLIKGIHIHNIDISNHKCIYKITRMIDVKSSQRILEGVSLPSPNSNIPFISLQRLLRILILLKDLFEYEEFEKLQYEIFRKFKELLVSESFKNFVDEYFKKYEDNYMSYNLADLNQETQTKELNQREFNYYNQDIVERDNFQTKDEKATLIEKSNEKISSKISLPEINLKFKDSGKDKEKIIPLSKVKKSPQLKFYFWFFHYLSIKTYYFFYDLPEEKEQLDSVQTFTNLDLMTEILDNQNLPMNYRTYLLVFLRTFNFIHILYSKQGNLQNSFLTNEEMHKYHYKLYSNKEEGERIEKKTQATFRLIKVMDIFVSELERFENLVKHEHLYVEHVKEYLNQLVYSVKIITDFIYYQKTILDKVIWYLYKLGKRFIHKSVVIEEVLRSIESTKEIGNIITNYKNVSEEMENISFNVYNKDLIYNLISNSLIKILRVTNLDKKFRLEKYLREYDRQIQHDFTPAGLIELKGYDEFYTQGNFNRMKTLKEKYEYNEKEDPEQLESRTKNTDSTLKKLLRKIYKLSFIKIYDSCLLRVLNTYKTKDDTLDYRKILLDYFLNYFSADPENKQFYMKVSNKIYTEKTLLTLLKIISKILYYDTKNTQIKFDILNVKYLPPSNEEDAPEEQLDLCKQFFKSFFHKLQKIFALNFSTSINFHMFDRYCEISEINKLMIQFLQLLAEGFNSSFISKIFELKITRIESISIFDVVYTNFLIAYNLMDLNSKIASNNELSHYKLIVLFSNIIDFFIEYVEGTESTSNQINKIPELMQNIFDDQIHKCLLTRIDDKKAKNENITNEKIELSKKLLLRAKFKIMELLISFLEYGVDEAFLKLILKELPMTRLFEEIQYHLHELLLKFREKCKNIIKDTLNIYNYDAYNFCYEIIKLYTLEDEFTNSLELNLCMKIFIFISILSDVYGIKTIEDHFGQLKKKTKDSPEFIEDNLEIDTNNRTSFFSPNAFKVYKFMQTIVKKVDIKNFEENKIYKCFFFRPPITFYLSLQTQRQFLDSVDRESRFSKLSSLIKQTDYFIFEMIYYSHFNWLGRKLNLFLDLYYLEIFNYILIVIHQILLLTYYYRSTSNNDSDYVINDYDKYKLQDGNLILSIIQIIYIAIILLLWSFLQLPLIISKNLMANESQRFLFRRKGEEKREIIYKFKETSLIKGPIRHFKFIRYMNRNISFWTKLKVSLFDSFLFNRNVSTMIFTLILIIFYLSTGSALFIVFPVLFLINIMPILYGMFVALKTKWLQLLTMLIYTYLCIYFFMWVTFYFTYPLFEFEDIYVSQGNTTTENLCNSAIECYLTMIDLGFRSGGGIGDVLPKASWKLDISFFMIRFFYNITFHIIIILILANSCFGIIVDAFSDLRDKTNAIEEDKKNICYICQLSRDDSLNKNIRFDEHTKKVHYPWNYVYFITHLLLNDSNDFNRTEYYVWEKIYKSTYDIGWVPGETEEEND